MLTTSRVTVTVFMPRKTSAAFVKYKINKLTKESSVEKMY